MVGCGLSCQDPFTLPSHLVTKDPAEYAESLLRSYGGRQHSDNGHYSEPLQTRNVRNNASIRLHFARNDALIQLHLLEITH